MLPNAPEGFIAFRSLLFFLFNSKSAVIVPACGCQGLREDLWQIVPPCANQRFGFSPCTRYLHLAQTQRLPRDYRVCQVTNRRRGAAIPPRKSRTHVSTQSLLISTSGVGLFKIYFPLPPVLTFIQ